MNCEALTEVILSIGRVSILLIALLAATLSIYLGWRLYREKMKAPTSGELSWNGFKIALTASSPGIFLALFGAVMIVTIVNTRLTLGSETETRKAALLAAKRASVSNWQLTQVTDRAERLTCQPGCIPVQEVLVKKTYRQLYSGGSAPTPEEVVSAIDLAIGALSKELNLETDTSRAIAIRSAIRVLSSSRDGVVKDR